MMLLTSNSLFILPLKIVFGEEFLFFLFRNGWMLPKSVSIYLKFRCLSSFNTLSHTTKEFLHLVTNEGYPIN